VYLEGDKERSWGRGEELKRMQALLRDNRCLISSTKTVERPVTYASDIGLETHASILAAGLLMNLRKKVSDLANIFV
jgi:hypothetical protein